jgi:hypothetical protein
VKAVERTPRAELVLEEMRPARLISEMVGRDDGEKLRRWRG